MKVHPAAQGSVEWMSARAGIPTASEFDQLLTPGLAVRLPTSEMPRSYLAKKLAERWLGGPLASFNTFDVDQGRILEEEAIPWFELEYGPIERVGLITTDDGEVGCSPDGLIGFQPIPDKHGNPTTESGIEIKCPETYTHCKWLLDGKLPVDHAAQVHGAMYVTGAAEWKFLSYRRKFPPLLVTVYRDESIQLAIEQAVVLFCERLERAYELLTKLNGGPPYRSPIPTSKPEYQPDMNDVPT